MAATAAVSRPAYRDQSHEKPKKIPGATHRGLIYASRTFAACPERREIYYTGSSSHLAHRDNQARSYPETTSDLPIKDNFLLIPLFPVVLGVAT
jgi:hypothetical protein